MEIHRTYLVQLKRRFICFAALLLMLPSIVTAGNDGKERNSRIIDYRTYFTKSDYYDDLEPDTLNAKGWSFGLNVGAFFANQYSGNFYNGRIENENNVRYILDNKYYYEDIKRLVNFSDTFIVNEDDLPYKMSYNVAVSVGLMAKFNFSRTMGLMLSANYARLNTSDYFVAEVDPVSHLAQPDLRLYPIYGIEERVMIDIGLSKLVQVSEKTNVFIEAGMNMTDCKVKKHEIEIEGRAFNLVNIYGNQPYIPNTELQETYNKQGGIGIGAFVTGGVQFIFNEKLSMDPGVSMYWQNIKLPDYESIKPSFNLFVRFSFIEL